MSWDKDAALLYEGGFNTAEIDQEKQRQAALLREGGYEEEEVQTYFQGEQRGLIDTITDPSTWSAVGADMGTFFTSATEAPSAILQGVTKAASETVNTLAELMPSIMGGSFGLLPGMSELKEAVGVGENKIATTLAEPVVEALQPETGTGTFVSAMTQFLVPFAASSKAKVLEGAGAVVDMTNAAFRGSMVDMVAMSAQEGNIFNAINAYAPELSGPLTEYLATSPNDSTAEGKLKNAITGMGFGAIVDGLFMLTAKGLRSVKGAVSATTKRVTTEDEIVAAIDVAGGRFQKVARGNMTRISSDTGESLPAMTARAQKDPAFRQQLMVENPVFKDSVVRTPDGKLQRVYTGYSRGTVTDMSRQKMDPEALYGPGIYTTVNPEIASSYAKVKDTPVSHTPTIEELREFYKPGEVVPGYGGRMDKVIGFHETKNGWFVEVQEVSPTSQTPLGSPRTHSTMPNAQALMDKGTIEAPAGPNVAPMHLNLKNVFDADKTFTAEEIGKLKASLDEGAQKQLRWNGEEELTGQDLYKRLIDTFGGAKADVNEALENFGFDGVTHTGGQILGGGKTLHKVFVAFDPANVKGAFLEPAYIPAPKTKPLAEYMGKRSEDPEGVARASMSSDKRLMPLLRQFAAEEAGEVRLPSGEDVADFGNRVRDEFFDDRDPFYRFTKALAGDDPKALKRAMATDNLATMLNGTHSKATFFTKHGVTLDDGKKLSDGLFPIVKGMTKEVRDEVNGLLKGTVNPLDASSGAHKAHTRLLKYYQSLYRYAEQSGLIPEEEWRNILTLPSTKNDILEELRDETFRIVTATERNKAALALANLARNEIPLEKAPRTIKPKGKGEVDEGDEKVRPMLGLQYRFRQDQLPKNQLLVMVDGKPFTLDVGEDVVDALHSMRAPELDMVDGIHQLGAIAVRAAINYNPVYQIIQLMRDEVWQFVHTKDGTIPFLEPIMGLGHMFGKNKELYHEWMRNGGGNEVFRSVADRYLKDKLPKNAADVGWYDMGWNAVKSPFTLMKAVADVSFYAGRVGRYARLKGKGVSQIEAAIGARTSRLDFQRMGSAVRRRNVGVAFLGASLNDMERSFGSFIKRPGSTMWKATMALTVPGIAAWALNKDEDWYKAAPDWKKDTWLPVSENFWVPLPYHLGLLFVGLPRRLMEKFVNDNPAAFDNLWESIGYDLTPPLMSSTTAPIMEHMFNHSFSTGNPILSQSQLERLPPERYTPYTSETAKLASRFLYDTTGIGVGPAYIDNYIKGWGAAMGDQAVKWADSALVTAGVIEDPVKPTTTMAENPFFRSFTTRYPSFNDARIGRFYDRVRKHDELMGSLRQMKKEVLAGANADNYVNMLQNHAVDLIELDGIKKALDNQKKFADSIYLNRAISPDEKRQLLDMSYKNMAIMAQNGNLMLDILDMVKNGEAE